MRRLAGAVALAVAGLPLAAAVRQPAAGPSALLLWYRQPAAQWVEALPIGNGRLAAMVFGGVPEERLQLNEDTLWSGGPYDPGNPDALAALPKVRRLLDDGDYNAAVALISASVMARPLRQMPYQPLGDLRLTIAGGDSATEYRRELDLGGEIDLLPALPSTWLDGRVTGLRARGGFEVDLEWHGGVLTGGEVRAVNADGPAHLRYGSRTADVPLRRGQRYRLVADGGFPGGR